MKIHRIVVIHRRPADLYAFWRKIENLAQLAPGDTSAIEVSPRRSHWTAIGPGGRRFEWDAEITTETPDHDIAWQSMPGADVNNSGHVRFEPIAGDTTRVELEIEYTPPGGFAGRLIGGLVKQHLDDEVDAGLERVKRRLERDGGR